jgi:hypothetical protein
MQSPTLYYFAVNDKTFGPFTLDEYNAIEIPNDAYVCNDLDMTWRLNKLKTTTKTNELENTQVVLNGNPSSSQLVQKKKQRFNLEKKSTPVVNQPSVVSKVVEKVVVSNTTVQSKKSNQMLYITAASFVLIIGLLFYFLGLKPFLRDKNAPRMYSYVNSLVFRSSPMSGVDYNILDNIKFGSELIVYSNTGEWVNCKYNGTEGYASNKFLLNKEEFFILNSIFADQNSREIIETAKCRKAILDYFKSNHIIGNLNNEIQKELWGEPKNNDQWVIYAKPKNVKPNTVIYPRALSKTSKFTDFGFLITNLANGKRKFILYTFSENEEPIFVAEQDAPENGDLNKITSKYINGQQYIYVNYL